MDPPSEEEAQRQSYRSVVLAQGEVSHGHIPVTLPFPISGPVPSTSSLIRAQLHPEPEEGGTEHSQGLRRCLRADLCYGHSALSPEYCTEPLSLGHQARPSTTPSVLSIPPSFLPLFCLCAAGSSTVPETGARGADRAGGVQDRTAGKLC